MWPPSHIEWESLGIQIFDVSPLLRAGYRLVYHFLRRNASDVPNRRHACVKQIFTRRQRAAARRPMPEQMSPRPDPHDGTADWLLHDSLLASRACDILSQIAEDQRAHCALFQQTADADVKTMATDVETSTNKRRRIAQRTTTNLPTLRCPATR